LGLLTAAALSAMIAATTQLRMRTLLLGGATLAAAVAALAIWLSGERAEYFSGGLVLDAYSGLATVVVASCAAAVLLISLDAEECEETHRGEYVALVLFATLGAALMTATEDFVAFFIALQLSSLPLYVLAGFNVRNRLATEAAIKFLLLGMVASVIMLYGFSITFVHSPSSSFAGMGGGSDALAPAALVGLVFVLVGFAFKVGAAPMHYWIPDTYQGAAAPITALLSTVPKFGALAALGRFATLALAGPAHVWSQGVFALLAVLSMVVGNLIALVQTDVKRMLAYSSIAHVGYILVAFACGAQGDALTPVLFYGVIYALTNVGAFAVINAVSGGDHDVPLDSLAGLWKRSPLLAGVLVVLVLSMLGIPPTPGFWAKFGIISLAIDADRLWLAALVVFASVVSVVYYVRIVRIVFVSPPTEETLDVAAPTRAVVAMVAVVTAVFGLWPAGLSEIVGAAARSVSGGG
jgi:NADH-quinone oxidoreductase subunit N